MTGPDRPADAARHDRGAPPCPAGCDVVYAVANRKMRRRLAREGRRLVDGLVAAHADGCPFNTGPATAQHTMAAANPGKRSAW